MLALSAVVAVGLVVAGCTDDEPDPRPSVEETVEPSPTETPEPEPAETSPTKPERPAAMDRDDAEGAAATAEYFIELYPYVMTTGDTAEWEAMSLPECQACAGFIDQARTIAERQDVFSGGEITATVGDPGLYVRDVATGIQPLDLEFRQEAMSISDTEGTEIFSSAAEASTKRVEMGMRDGQWTVVTIGDLPS